MALDFATVDWIAVLVATIAQAALGAAWFGAFAGPWAAAVFPGKTKAEIQAGPKWPYAVAVGGALVTAVALAVLLAATAATTAMAALAVALVVWVGFIAMSFAISYSFEWRSPTILLVDSGYHLVRVVAAALVLSLWP